MINQKISVLLPVFNNQSTVAIAIQSILNQSYTEFELLILDDGSADGSLEVIKQFTDTRIQYYSFPHRGLTATLNDGLQKAKYEIIARMDADDISHPKRFEIQLQEFLTLPTNYFLSSWYGIFTEDKLHYIIQSPTASQLIKKGLLLHSYVAHSGLMFYKKTLQQLGGYQNTISYQGFEDYQTWLQYKDKIEFRIIPNVLLLVGYRKESLSNDVRYKYNAMYKIQKPYYEDLSLHFGISETNDENLWKGWREYFFGDKSKAREYWFAIGFHLLRFPKVLIAIIVSFLPEKQFIIFKESRLRFRLQYYLTYFSQISRNARVLLRTYTRIEPSK